jgi:hypothetical protein
MLRLKFLLLFTVSSLLILISCSDTSTDSGDTNGGEEPIEPTASVSNPGDGDNLEGEITFVIDGESENGFDEARIFVGDEQVETVSNPSLPYEQTIATYDFDNGDYDLSAELDVAEEDTTIEASISVTLENYMVTLETDGYIAALDQQNSLEAKYMFVADPEGNVLRAVELTGHSDGTFKLLPPKAFEEDAPSQYNITIGDLFKFDTPDGTFESFRLETSVGLESWSKIYKYGNPSSGDGPDEPVTTDLTITLRNHPNVPLISRAEDPHLRGLVFDIPYDGDVSQRTVSVREDAEELLLTTYPEDPSNTPKYYREQNVQDSLESSGSLRYDVGGNENFEGFQEWDVADVSIPSNVEITNYFNVVSAQPDTWEEGRFGLFPNLLDVRDGNDSSTQLGMYVIDWSDHLYHTIISANGDAGASYTQQTNGDLPSEFVVLDADLQLVTRNLDDLQLDIAGSFDLMRLQAQASGQSYSHDWSINIPDTMESFVYPKIADSLGQEVSNYSRSAFEFVRFTAEEVEEVENYGQVLTDQFGQQSSRMEGRFNTYSKSKQLSTDQESLPASMRKSLYGPGQEEKFQIDYPEGQSSDGYDSGIPKSLQRR